MRLNGTYNTQLLADEAARLVTAHNPATPFYMYLAFMAVHDGCGGPFKKLGKQAPCDNFDIVLAHFSRIYQHQTTPHGCRVICPTWYLTMLAYQRMIGACGLDLVVRDTRLLTWA